MRSKTNIDMKTNNTISRQRNRCLRIRSVVVGVATLTALLGLWTTNALTPPKPATTTTASRQQPGRSKNWSQRQAASLGTHLNTNNNNGRNNSNPNQNQRKRKANNNNNKNTNNNKHRHYNKNNSKNRNAASPSSTTSTSTSVFVKNLHYDATRDDIVRACRQFYGDVQDVHMCGKKGFANVTFRKLSAAQKALQNGRLKVLDRHAFVVENTRSTANNDPQSDAFRFLAAFGKGDFANLSKSRVMKAVGKAGTPRSDKERGILAASLARIGARDELLRILQTKTNPNQKKPFRCPATSVYNSALSALTVSDRDDCKLAQTIVRLAETGPGVNSKTYATAIASIKRGATAAKVQTTRVAGAADDLSQAAHQFLQKAQTQKVANHVVYNELIACLGKLNLPDRWKAATGVLDQMFEDDSVQPTAVSLNSAIASCANAGQIDAATQIYEQGFKRAHLTPNIVTTNSLVSTAHRWIKKRRNEHATKAARDTTDALGVDPSDAKRVVEFVKRVVGDATQRGDKLDGVSINSLVSAYGAAGDVRSALKLFQEACRTHQATTVTANAALSALATAGKANAARELLNKLPSFGIDADLQSWNTALAACGVAGDLPAALQLLRRLPFAPDAHSFASVLSAVASNPDDGHDDAAQATPETVQQLLSKADQAQATTTFVLNAALAAYDRLGDADSVQSLLHHGFAPRGLSPDVVSYNTAIRSLGASSDPNRAVELFDQLQNDAVLQPDEQSYAAVLSALASSGLHQDALAILEAVPSQHQTSPNLHNEVLRAFATAAEPEQALEFLSRMQTEGPSPDLLSTTLVMNACAKAGREHDAAFKIFEATPHPDLVAFNSAIALAEKAGDADLAVSYLTRLVRASNDDEESHLAPDAVSFCSAIAACERSDPPRARTALRLLKESLKAVGPNAACYIATVQTLAAAGDLDRALELLEHGCVPTFDDQSRFVLHRTVQVGCAAAGDTVHADRLAKKMKDQGLKALAPLASARVGGRLERFDNKIDVVADDHANATFFDTRVDGTSTETSMADVANKVQDLVRGMNHEFVTTALPLEFQAHSSRKSQELSLSNHAEKKALAKLLLEEQFKHHMGPDDAAAYQTLSIDINFKMCADCHAFFKGASAWLDRRITVKEPTMLHVFEDGSCSCGDSWRWEERHQNALLEPAAAAATTANRYGRLPPLLKP